MAKILLLVAGLGYLVASGINDKYDWKITQGLTSKAILATLLAFSASLMWTRSGIDVALLALVKHAKLIVILLLMYLIRSRQEARLGAIAFAGGQSFVLLSSWLLAAGATIPWVTDPNGKYVVFSSYLDQSIMLATTAAILWHLRQENLWPRWLVALLTAAALLNTILLLDGRTGYVVAIVMISLAVMWSVPKRLQVIAILIAPVLVLTIIYLGSTNVQEKISKIFQESQNYSQQKETETSSGWRLNSWQRSIEAIRESPWHGHGVGSWTITIKRLQGDSATKIFGKNNASNPHQEYLLWGVELGTGGSLLFIMVLLAMALDAKRFTPPIQRATWSILSALAVACMFNSTLYDDLIGDYFCVALGIMLALGFNGMSSQHHSKVVV